MPKINANICNRPKGQSRLQMLKWSIFLIHELYTWKIPSIFSGSLINWQCFCSRPLTAGTGSCSPPAADPTAEKKVQLVWNCVAKNTTIIFAREQSRFGFAAWNRSHARSHVYPSLNVITPVYLSFITILMSGEKICYPWNKVHLGIYHKLDFDVLEDLLIESLMKSYPFVRRTFLDFTAGFSASLIFPICCSWTCKEDSVSAFSGSHHLPSLILLFSAARNWI